MLKRAVAVALLTSFAVAVWGQEARQEEKKLSFRFKDASLDAVFAAVSSATGWVFVQEKAFTGTITAYSDTDVPLSKCLEFLNTALRPHGMIVVNPYSPNLPKPGTTLKVIDVSKAAQSIVNIRVGANPDDIPISDEMATQIIPLKAVNVIDVNKELGDVLKAAVGGEGQVAVSTYSNSIILTGRSDGINRAARILRVLDVSTSDELKIRVFVLKNADAVETAKTLNEVFKREAMKADAGASNPMSGFMRMFGGGDRDGGRGGGSSGMPGGGPQPRALAHEMVRITAEPRTNSVIVSATEDNMKLIEQLVLSLDDKTAGATKLKMYSLRYGDATSAAKLINDLFSQNGNGQGGRSNSGGSRDGRRDGGMMPMWIGGAPSSAAGEYQAQSREVRAVADLRTNSVLVAASEQVLVLIDGLILEIDRQINDIVEVKVYKLQNADPAQMATVLQALFRPQVQATNNTNRLPTGGGGNNFMQQMMRFNGSTGQNQPAQLAPSQEVEITSDTRTRAVIVKASREYILIMDEVIKKLDEDPTESVATYVIPLKNADATTLATTLQNLLRGTGNTGGFNNQNRFGQQGTQGQPMFGGMQQQGGQFGTNRGSNQGFNSGSNFGSSTRGSSTRGSSGRGGRLGPLEEQDPAMPLQDPQDEEDLLRRSIEGTPDVQADPTTNSLVIRTSPRNFQALQGVLQDLDRLRPQVLIKVLMAEVSLDHRTQFGVEGFWENKMTVRGGDKATNRFGTDFPLGTQQGFTYLLSGDEFQATLKLFAAEGKLKVLATPRMLVLDNQTAYINVGKDVPRITNSQVNQLGNTINSVTYESVGIKLEVTPHINPDGLVTMIVSPEVSDVASETESVEISPGVRNPTFNVNTATTSVAVRTGTTVAIGGLIRESEDESVEKVPVLGDIPLLGYFFSNTIKRKVQRELMIFLTPYVAFTSAELEELTELEKSRLKLMDPRTIDAESDRWLDRVRPSQGRP